MSDKVLIWHNPRCSKSRQTLALLQENGVEPEIREYLKDAPDHAELNDILAKLGLPPRGLMRTKEARYKELELKQYQDDAAELIDAMAENPALIERPVVIKGDQAALGRPPENVLPLIGK